MAEVANVAAEAPQLSEDEVKANRIAEAIRRCDAPIKPEFLLANRPKTPAPEAETKEPDAAKQETASEAPAEKVDGRQENGEPPNKKQKRNRGMNKNKDRQGNVAAMKKVAANQLCPRLAYLNECDGSKEGEPRCTQNHDLEKWKATKLPEICEECPVFKAVGVCAAGLNCRFGGHCVDGKNVDKDGVVLSKGSKWSLQIPHIGHVPGEANIFTDDIRQALRKKTYDFSRSVDLAKSWQCWHSLRGEKGLEEAAQSVHAAKFLGALGEAERKKVDLKGKTILAPLTTVGNLPFRRLCVKLGCDVTVGEMALGYSIIEGQQGELALLRRHESEKIYGVQIAGGDVETMTKVAQFCDENVDCDFVDINSGCPLDEVHKRGAGSRLMAKPAHMEGIVRCMSTVMKTKALTLKFRTAHMEDHKTKEFNGRYAHKLVPQLEDWGVSALTLHGRTARQRYHKLADWDYIQECSTRRQTSIPFIGGGDAMNWEQVEEHCSQHGVDSVMLGRGPLIKPWLFTEIKEKRHWDISASERLDMIRDFTHYGLEHWGADARGVETTRRFLLEWLSFTCRYVPLGLLEVQQAHINWRPRPYVGRSDLETKLASTNAKDWIEISEMVLGKVPDGFSFLPKHKSNAYKNEDSSGSAAPQAAEDTHGEGG
eukprot:TRINITY_DN17780_c0_g1_i1.p1 TRINITY_DN17780_c0_g1~~TRINITY_DN17780_c0_g1_i1.p1  ORF type:complete len:676 (+),score=145.61 TRINITY_DN17780_c0_g1_i1:69-2030(+)